MNVFPVAHCMTPCPFAVSGEDSSADAAEFMTEHLLEDLPVVDGRDIIGVLHLADARARRDAHAHQIAERAFVVCSPETPLTDVLARMTERGVEACVIVDERRIVGTFGLAELQRRARPSAPL
ncbi:MAG: CBS domain-containing protein [Polyangiaceae bacterium]